MKHDIKLYNQIMFSANVDFAEEVWPQLIYSNNF